MLRSVDLSDYMLHDPVKISPEDEVFTAISLIQDNKVSGVCVVDGEGMLVGVAASLLLPTPIFLTTAALITKPTVPKVG